MSKWDIHLTDSKGRYLRRLEGFRSSSIVPILVVGKAVYSHIASYLTDHPYAVYRRQLRAKFIT